MSIIRYKFVMSSLLLIDFGLAQHLRFILKLYHNNRFYLIKFHYKKDDAIQMLEIGLYNSSHLKPFTLIALNFKNYIILFLHLRRRT